MRVSRNFHCAEHNRTANQKTELQEQRCQSAARSTRSPGTTGAAARKHWDELFQRLTSSHQEQGEKGACDQAAGAGQGRTAAERSGNAVLLFLQGTGFVASLRRTVSKVMTWKRRSWRKRQKRSKPRLQTDRTHFRTPTASASWWINIRILQD